MHFTLDKFLLYIGCSTLFLYHYSSIEFATVCSVLIMFCYGLLTSYCNPDHNTYKHFQENVLYHIMLLTYLILCLQFPYLYCYLPFVLYDILFSQSPIIYILLVPVAASQMRSENILLMIPIVLLCLTAILLQKKSSHIDKLEHQLRELRDNSVENHMQLKRQNKALIEKQNYEINVATLNERNRIAREIHDNVGHMLSRSILLVGALSTINQNDSLKTPLESLSNTLQEAMNSIRSSVHDLHDDSIDVKASVLTILKDYSKYHVSFDYDMSPGVPRNIKYCFISIIKEALSNIVKHSNATKIEIIIREHPSIYQLLIHDNGTDIIVHNSGIGLENMQERVNAFHGTFTYQTNNGFRIFISISKKEVQELISAEKKQAE